jgi:hypothetical protein
MFIHWKYFRLLKTSSAHFGNLKRNCFRELEERNSIRTYVTEWQFLCRVSLTRNSRNEIFTSKTNCNIATFNKLLQKLNQTRNVQWCIPSDQFWLELIWYRLHYTQIAIHCKYQRMIAIIGLLTLIMKDKLKCFIIKTSLFMRTHMTI